MLTAHSGMTLAGFGATAGFFALFFFGEVPIVRKDILSVGSQTCTYQYAHIGGMKGN